MYDTDYEYLGECEFEVDAPWSPDGFSECREPAIAKVFWGPVTNGDNMLVCKYHLQEIQIKEDMCKRCRLAELAEQVAKCPAFIDMANECKNEVVEPGCSNGPCFSCVQLVDYFKGLDDYYGS